MEERKTERKPDNAGAGTQENGMAQVTFEAKDLDLSVIKVDAKGVILRLWPKVDAVKRWMNALPNGGLWAARHYMCGHALYCAVGFCSERYGDYVYRDAPCPATYKVGPDTVTVEGNGSFLAAAAQWGIGAGLLRMQDLVLSAEKVQINPVAGPDGKTIRSYVLADRLAVDRVLYDDEGEVIAIQLVNDRGGKVLWQKH